MKGIQWLLKREIKATLPPFYREVEEGGKTVSIKFHWGLEVTFVYVYLQSIIFFNGATAYTVSF